MVANKDTKDIGYPLPEFDPITDEGVLNNPDLIDVVRDHLSEWKDHLIKAHETLQNVTLAQDLNPTVKNNHRTRITQYIQQCRQQIAHFEGVVKKMQKMSATTSKGSATPKVDISSSKKKSTKSKKGHEDIEIVVQETPKGTKRNRTPSDDEDDDHYTPDEEVDDEVELIKPQRTLRQNRPPPGAMAVNRGRSRSPRKKATVSPIQYNQTPSAEPADSTREGIMMSTLHRIENQFNSFNRRLEKIENPGHRNVSGSQQSNYSREPTPRNPTPTIVDLVPPPNADGTISPSSELRKLWPHVDDSLIKEIITSKFPAKKLFELIPPNLRVGPEEKSNLTIDQGGQITLSPSKIDHSRQLKHFPTALTFIQALSLWAAIRQVYLEEQSARLFNLYFTKHIQRLINHTTAHNWSKVLNYELNFFQSYSKIDEKESLEKWCKNDSDLYIDNIGNSHPPPPNPPSSSLQARIGSRQNNQICLRYNRQPAEGQTPCDSNFCRYSHTCNYEPSHSHLSHPAYLCLANPNRITTTSRRNPNFEPRGTNYKSSYNNNRNDHRRAPPS